ncbi:MAG: aminoacyl-tRNA hydrolase [Candidatus Uhrbacteria bacterium]
MKLLVGLGNPGKAYENTRHNVGWLVLNKLAAEYFAAFENKKRWNARVAPIQIHGEQVVMIKPQTFMNRSGEAVQAARGWFRKVPIENIWVVHDDVDLPLGEIRIKQGGGSAGHRGVDSIAKMVGSVNFWRVRIGISRPENPNVPLEDYVLKKFSADEMKQVENIVDEARKKIIDQINGK